MKSGTQQGKKGWSRGFLEGCLDPSGCRYHSLAPMYYRGAQAAIVVYDITNADTFERAKSWVKELQRQVRVMEDKSF